MRWIYSVAVSCTGLLYVAAAQAENTIALGDLVASAGAEQIVSIIAATESPLTLLSVDITFDRALCDQLEDQTIVAAGRAVAQAQEGGIRCPDEGRVSLVFFDLNGDEIIPHGEGAIAEWQFNVRGDAAGGDFPVSLTVRQASNGPLVVPVETFAADLRILSSGVLTCLGDCDQDGAVEIHELVGGVRMALGSGALSLCPRFDSDGSGRVEITELVRAVKLALAGCH